jgi:hypothetical protein
LVEREKMINSSHHVSMDNIPTGGEQPNELIRARGLLLERRKNDLLEFLFSHRQLQML